MGKNNKKISFQVFLRNPDRDVAPGFFKVYLRINFNAESNKLAEVLFDGTTLHWTQKDLEKWEKGDYSGPYKGQAYELRKSIEFYEEIIRYEYEKSPDKFKLKGFSKLVKFYGQDVFTFITKHISYYLSMRAIEISSNEVELSSLVNDVNSEVANVFIINKDTLGDISKTLLEFYTLMMLYQTAHLNTDYDYVLGNTLFQFAIRDGIQVFDKFIDDFLNESTNYLNFEYLTQRIEDKNSKELHLKLLSQFPISFAKRDQYKYLFREHIKMLLSSRSDYIL